MRPRGREVSHRDFSFRKVYEVALPHLSRTVVHSRTPAIAGHDRRSLGRGALALVLLCGTLVLSGSVAAIPLTGSGSTAPAGPAAIPPGTVTGPLPVSPAAQPAANLTLSVSGVSTAAVSLNWSEAPLGTCFLTSYTFDNYTVRYSAVGPGGPFQVALNGVIGSRTTPEYVTGSLSPGGTYWWEVTAYLAIPALCGGGTQIQTSNVLSESQATLAYLTKWVRSTTSVQLNWTDNETYGGLLAFQSFGIYQKNSSSQPFARVAEIPNNVSRSYNVTGLTPGANYSFYLNTTDCLGASCSSGISTTSSNSVTVGTPFPLSASISAARADIDVGEPDLLSCNAAGGSAPYTFSWSINGSAYVRGNSTVVVTFPSQGTSVVTIPVACQVNATTPPGARSSTGLFVYPTLTLSATLNRTSADVNEPIEYLCASTGGMPSVAYLWAFGDGASLSGNAGTHAYTTNGTFVASCMGTDGAGVSVTSSIAVTVSPLLSLSATVSSATAAPGTSLTFTATATNGSSPYSGFDWQFGGAGSASGPTVTHAFSTPGRYSVTVRISDANGLPATASVAVSVSLLTVQSVAAPTNVTVGSALTFSANAIGGAGGPYNYSWNFGDGSVAYGPTVVHSYNATGTFTPVLTVTDRLGATHVTGWPAVQVAAAPSPLAWLPLWVLAAIGAGAGAVLAVVIFWRMRADDRTGSAALSRWVPPVGPRGVVHGSKMCPSCGAANSSLRRSCQVCGASLPRTPAR